MRLHTSIRSLPHMTTQFVLRCYFLPAFFISTCQCHGDARMHGVQTSRRRASLSCLGAPLKIVSCLLIEANGLECCHQAEAQGVKHQHEARGKKGLGFLRRGNRHANLAHHNRHRFGRKLPRKAPCTKKRQEETQSQEE